MWPVAVTAVVTGDGVALGEQCRTDVQHAVWGAVVVHRRIYGYVGIAQDAVVAVAVIGGTGDDHRVSRQQFSQTNGSGSRFTGTGFGGVDADQADLFGRAGGLDLDGVAVDDLGEGGLGREGRGPRR